MTSMMRGLGQILTVAAFVAALLFGATPAAPTAAQPVNDVRDLKIKVRDFKSFCKDFGGTATSRPSAMDDDKQLVSCTGGTNGGGGCVYTSTTSDCYSQLTDTKRPGTVPQVDDNLGVERGTGMRDAAASDAAYASPAKDKHGKHDQTGRKHRRR